MHDHHSTDHIAPSALEARTESITLTLPGWTWHTLDALAEHHHVSIDDIAHSLLLDHLTLSGANDLVLPHSEHLAVAARCVHHDDSPTPARSRPGGTPHPEPEMPGSC